MGWSGRGLAGVSGFVSFCLDSLMEGGRLSSGASNHSSALAKDGALIVAAVSSLQTRLNALLGSVDRVLAMKLHYTTEKRGGVEHIIDVNAKPVNTSFGTDLSNLFLDYWVEPSGAFSKGLCHTLDLHLKEDGTALFGTIEMLSAKRSPTYSNMNPMALDRRDFISMSTTACPRQHPVDACRNRKFSRAACCRRRPRRRRRQRAADLSGHAQD